MGGQLFCIVEINGQKLRATIDSGAIVNSMAPEIAAENGFKVQRKAKSSILNQADGETHSSNDGWTTHETTEVTMRMIRDHQESIVFDLVPGECEVILGANWLRKHNVRIDWLKETIVLECDCGPKLAIPKLKREDATLGQQN